MKMDNVWVIYTNNADFLYFFNRAVYSTKEKAIIAIKKEYEFWNCEGYWTEFVQNGGQFEFKCHDSFGTTRVRVWAARLFIE